MTLIDLCIAVAGLAVFAAAAYFIPRFLTWCGERIDDLIDQALPRF